MQIREFRVLVLEASADKTINSIKAVILSVIFIASLSANCLLLWFDTTQAD
jgi:hypothetical protein